MPSKNQSIGIGVGISVVLGLLFSFLSTSGGQVVQTLGGCGACLVALIAPMAAVWHYTSTYNLTIPAGQGAGMGAIVGVAGAILSGAFSLLLQTIGVFPTTAEAIEQQRQQLEAQGMDPAQIEQTLQFAESFSNPLIAVVAGVAFGALLGAIGGAIGAAIFKKGSAADEFDV